MAKQMTAKVWNRIYPVGVPIRFFPNVKNRQQYVVSTTIAAAFSDAGKDWLRIQSHPDPVSILNIKPYFKSQTYRLYPTQEQATELVRWFSVCCLLWNRVSDMILTNWREIASLPKEERKAKRISSKQLSFLIKSARHQLPWIESVAAVVERDTVISAFMSAFKGYMELFKKWVEAGSPIKGRPRQPGKIDSEDFNRLECWQPDNIALRQGRKFGMLDFSTMKNLKVRLHRPLVGIIRTATIRREADGWYVRISYVPFNLDDVRKTNKEVGVNLGVINLITRTDGRKIQVPQDQFFRIIKTIAILDRIVSRRKRGSKRRKIAEALREKRYLQLARARDHFVRVQAYRLMRDNQVVAMEDMNLAKMIEESGGIKCRQAGVKAKKIVNAVLRKLKLYMMSKAEMWGRTLVLNEPQYTTMTCSNCRYVGPKIPLRIRTFTCPQCGHSEDRELNAAKNNLQLAHEKLGVEKT